jgi:hypothetical protein
LDSEIHLLNSDNLPASLKSLPKSLGISNDKAVIVSTYRYLIFIVNLIATQFDERVYRYIHDG